ncbi:MAG: site-2 protease family protein [Saprospiraceae bacterium]
MFDKGTIQLAVIAGIPVRLHWSFLLIFVWVGYNAWIEHLSMTGFLFLQLYVIILFLCVVMHEYGHALMARRFGNKTRDILLTPIGGIARLESISEKPAQELLIAVAGPLVNIVIASVLALILFFTGRFNLATIVSAQNMLEFDIVPLLFVSNIILALFNFIPAFPMDGGRILRALLSFKWSRLQATRIAARLGQICAVAFLLFAFYNEQWMLSLIGIFIFITAGTELKQVKWESILNVENAGNLAYLQFDKLQLFDNIDLPIENAKKGLDINYIVYNGDLAVGTLTNDRILYCIKNKIASQPVSAIMNPQLILTTPEESLKTVYQRLQTHGAHLALVKNNDQVIGIIGDSQLKRFVEMKLNREI